MTPQEVFDKASRHLLAQNKKSGKKNDKGLFECLYRGPDGTMCGAGPLIPDEVYTESMEGMTIQSLIRYYEWPHLESSMALLQNIQSIHDETEVENWKEDLADLANRRFLSSAVLNDFA